MTFEGSHRVGQRRHAATKLRDFSGDMISRLRRGVAPQDHPTARYTRARSALEPQVVQALAKRLVLNVELLQLPNVIFERVCDCSSAI
jgi:hypothetical protein